MAIEDTIRAIVSAESFNQRIQQLRLVPQRHGTEEHVAIYATVARELYLPHLAPDFAYIHESPFYEAEYFNEAYQAAYELTQGFLKVSEDDLQSTLLQSPQTLLVFRTLLGLTKQEFAYSTWRAGEPEQLQQLSASQIDKLERCAIEPSKQRASKAGTARAAAQAKVAAKTIAMAMDGRLFGDAPSGSKSKQLKPDTQSGWESVRAFAANGVPLSVFLHQRHYGGAFRQVLDATSTRRGDVLELAVEEFFLKHQIRFVRTGSHNQAEIARRFEVRVTPAPDFVVYDPNDDSLLAILECKGTNDGGTARDKALRYRTLKAEAMRLGGIPLLAVLGGIGWARINDALGPVVRDTDGRVFTPSTLHLMLEIAPFATFLRSSARMTQLESD